MQTPTSLAGLRASLKALGFGSALDGLDVGSPDAKAAALAHIEWLASKNPDALESRRLRSVHLVNLFDWSSVLKAARQHIPAPEGTKTDVFSKPKKLGPKHFQVKSPTRTVELLADVAACLKEAVEILE